MPNAIKLFSTLSLLLIVLSLLPTLIYAGGGAAAAPPAPPPPPPPCPIKSAGCYKVGDVKAAFGELSLSEFGYYLPESKCIVGGCTCGGVPSNVVEQKDPDESSGACTCIAGAFWNTKGRCCGDDSDDCGKVASGVLCSIDANSVSANWIASSTSIGDIRYVGCARAEFLSDGETWIKCSGAFWKKTVGNSEYICIGKGRESIIECCGDGSCKSRVDGKRLSTGQSANPAGYEGDIASPENKTYYCRTDRKFVTDLDVPNSQIEDKALISKQKTTCERAGLAWTGTKCCSEADDANEYYNDPGGKGGCWDNEPVISISIVDGADASVLNYKGEFHGCAIEKTKFNKDNDDLLSIVDQHTGGPLIISHEYCFNDPEQNYYCSYTEKWLPTDYADRTHFSLAPIPSQIQQGECCAKDECWAGEKCIENQKSSPLAQPINGFRCIDGNWTKSAIKSNSDNSVSGYCPKQTQCLVKIFGKEEEQCIESGMYIGDNYCEDGNWTSRTKLLALKLLKLKSGDFTLFCDNRENTLNNLQYLTESNEVAGNVLANLQTNNFCILKTENNIIAATSINKNLEDVSANSLNIFGVTDCEDEALIDDGQYHSCDETNKVWFNMVLKSFIYSPNAITIPSEQELSSTFEEFILNPIKTIIDTIKRLITKPPFDESYLKGIKKFDKLYITEQGSKSIMGSIEGANFKNAVIEYRGFDTDICNLVDKFSQAKKDASSGVSCKKEGNNYYVLVQGSKFTIVDPDFIWPDLTSKLRIK